MIVATFARHLGRVLRLARQHHGLTLRQASSRSNGRFPPTSLASYERGERAISVERFCRLAGVYGIPPERLLAEAMRATEERSRAIVDLQALERLGNEEAVSVAGFVRQVVRLRGEPPAGPVTLRTGDLEVLATASGRRSDVLRRAIEPALATGT